MGDTNHGNGGGGAGDTGADDNKANETVDEADTTQKSGAKDDAGDDSGDAGDDSGSDDGDDQGKGDSKKGSDDADDDTEDDVDDGAEPELRKPKHGASNAEWAAWRAQEKAKASKSKDTKQTDKNKSGDDTKGDDDVDDEDDDGLSPEDAAAFDKRIEKHLKPYKEQAAEQEVDGAIATFLKDNPDFTPFAAKAKRFAMHPSRQSVPIKSIFYEVAGDKLMRIGAQRAKAADDKAKKTKTGGGSASVDQQGSKSYKDMPLKDFEKELEAVKTGGRR